MSMQNDKHRGINQGWVICRPAGQAEFIKCFLVLDRSKNLLICYKRPQQSSNQEHLVGSTSWPIAIQFETDSISLVEEAPKVKKQFCFAIHSLAKITHICAESWKDMEDWIHCIKESSRISVNKSDLNPNRVSITGSYTTEVVGGHIIQTPVIQRVDEANTISAHDPSEHSIDSGSSDPQSLDSLPFPPIDKEVIKSSYCVKQGAVRKSWKRRFLALTSDEVMYYRNESASKPLRRIPLFEIKDVKASSGELGVVRSNLLDLVTTDRTFRVQLDSIEEMYSWISEIRRVANLSTQTYL